MTINERVSDERLSVILSEYTKHAHTRFNCMDTEVAAMARELQQYRAAAEPVAWRYRYTKPGVTDSHGEPWVGDWKYVADEENCNPMKNYERQPLYAAPQVTSVPDDYFASLVSAARARADKAMRKFPQPNYVLNKVAEENGEVIKAVIHYTEGRETWINVEGEIIDNLAMLIRLVQEGDQVIGFTPPDACRTAMLNGGRS
ncbi:hypothetical protein [Atlantibacter hermannii]|uniref:hypothetical protein n=1 Tax=Atlantibacter hermannii TaxID=565 RepID=UPI0032B4F3BA